MSEVSPGESSVNFDADIDTLCADIAEQFACNEERYGDILDIDSEFHHSPFLLWALAERLASMMASDSEQAERLQSTYYRSMRFAIDSANMIVPAGSESLMSIGYLESVSSSEDIVNDVGEYLSKRPFIDGLVGAYIPEIDQRDVLPHHAEIGAGLTFMLLEQTMIARNGLIQIEQMLREQVD